MSNYDSNPYNAGGFVQNGSPYGSQSGSQGEKGKKKIGTIRPVTIKQLIEADKTHADGEFLIDGVEINSVILVGGVRNISASATNVGYEIGDGTGYIDARLWLDTSDDEGGKTSGIEQDKYVAVLGSIKEFNGKRHISATHVRPITDPNEIFHHFLKALHVSLSIRYPGSGGGGGGGAAPAAHGDYSAAGATNGGADATAWAHLPELHRRIMDFVGKEESDDGVHVSVISKQVKAGGEEVMEAIETLMSDGILFSTIDDLHVKAI